MISEEKKKKKKQQHIHDESLLIRVESVAAKRLARTVFRDDNAVDEINRSRCGVVSPPVNFWKFFRVGFKSRNFHRRGKGGNKIIKILSRLLISRLFPRLLQRSIESRKHRGIGRIGRRTIGLDFNLV